MLALLNACSDAFIEPIYLITSRPSWPYTQRLLINIVMSAGQPQAQHFHPQPVAKAASRGINGPHRGDATAFESHDAEVYITYGVRSSVAEYPFQLTATTLFNSPVQLFMAPPFARSLPRRPFVNFPARQVCLSRVILSRK